MNFKVIEIDKLNDALEIKRKGQSITEDRLSDTDTNPVMVALENSCIATNNLKFSASPKNRM